MTCDVVRLIVDYADENLALNKPASQVSTDSNLEASLAVDGRLDTSSCTTSIVSPWLSVDLEAAYHIGRVTVTNDDDALLGIVVMAAPNLMHQRIKGVVSCAVCCTQFLCSSCRVLKLLHNSSNMMKACNYPSVLHAKIACSNCT